MKLTLLRENRIDTASGLEEGSGNGTGNGTSRDQVGRGWREQVLGETTGIWGHLCNELET